MTPDQYRIRRSKLRMTHEELDALMGLPAGTTLARESGDIPISHEAELAITSLLRKRIDWTAVDWTQTTAALARSMGLHVNHVGKQRSIYAPDTVRKTTRPRGVDWSVIDLSRPARAIADQLGVSIHAVYHQQRKQRAEKHHDT
jgi:hypothetical protein